MHKLIFTYSVSVALLLLVTSLSSCSTRDHKVIKRDKMIDVLVDLQLANSTHNSALGNEKSEDWREVLIESVLDKHKVTEDDLDYSLRWYADNIKEYSTINDSVISRLKANNSSLTAKRDRYQKAFDQKDKVLLPPYFYLNNLTPTLSFNIDSVNIKEIDLSRFYLSFDIQGLNSDLERVTLGLYYVYKDTLVNDVLILTENRNYLIDKPSLPDSLLRSISGYIHLRRREAQNETNISIYNIIYQQEEVATEKGNEVEDDKG